MSIDLEEYGLKGMADAGRLSVCENPDAASESLERRFRFGAGQLQWADAHELGRISPPASRAAGANHNATDFKSSDWLVEVKKFIASLGLESGQRVYLASEFADFVVFSVKLGDISEVLDGLHDVPSHKYIFPADAAWCIHWSFEDEVVYGTPKDA